jgi:hypothetical protein
LRANATSNSALLVSSTVHVCITHSKLCCANCVRPEMRVQQCTAVIEASTHEALPLNAVSQRGSLQSDAGRNPSNLSAVLTGYGDSGGCLRKTKFTLNPNIKQPVYGSRRSGSSSHHTLRALDPRTYRHTYPKLLVVHEERSALSASAVRGAWCPFTPFLFAGSEQLWMVHISPSSQPTLVDENHDRPKLPEAGNCRLGSLLRNPTALLRVREYLKAR